MKKEKVVEDYFKWQAAKLEQEYYGSKIEDHHPDTGSNREIIVREWLTQHLPRTVTPEIGGKILDETGFISEQIDLVIYNNGLPRFGANEKSYYFAEGVITAIQVKSKLTRSTLTSAIKNLATVKNCKVQQAGMSIGTPRACILTGIFAFEKEDKDFSSLQSIIDALKRHEKKGLPVVNFIYINRRAYIVYNEGAWEHISDDGKRTMHPEGYLLLNNSENCLWRMVLSISNEAVKDIALGYDFQKYFQEDILSQVTPVGTDTPK